MTRGWLLDSYPKGDKIVSWIKNKDGITKVEDYWTGSIYAACDDKTELEMLAKNPQVLPYIKDAQLVERFEKVTDQSKSTVLQLTLQDSSYAVQLGKIIESIFKFGQLRLYNVDVMPAQSFFYENEIFPFGKCIKDKKWVLDDDILDTDYELPNFKFAIIKVNPKKEGKIPKFSDKINSITVNETSLESSDEVNVILEFVKNISNLDPDYIITRGGDTFDLPYLVHRAEQNNVSESLILGRETTPLVSPKRKGVSYFSYGRIHYKPTAITLFGRLHIDTKSCFIYDEKEDLQGLYELARVCRLPLQTASRASIGKCMSSLQFYYATKRGLLIPWKPTLAEAFKTRKELLIGDRGGLIFEPEIGVYENVVELDFVSMYGTIMQKKNISAETISCTCCPDSENRVPDLGYNICKKLGIVPQSLEILLKKRGLYSELLAIEEDSEKKKIYDARKSALKWILVTSFGYLGFNNAKFGRIDAHMAVCAFARHLLLQAVRISESHGFRILHGIVDSLWLYKKDSTREECDNLRKIIEHETGFSLSLDIYKWIVFVSSKNDNTLPVANRYFGAFESGELKVRGIELRRHDTPLFFKRLQDEILSEFAIANNIDEVKKMLPKATKIYEKYLKELEDRKVSSYELAFTTRASKKSEDYKVNTVQTDAILQLKQEGLETNAGQKIEYVITDYTRKTKRSTPLAMARESDYDVKRYTKLLDQCYKTITQPFVDGELELQYSS